MNMLEFIACFTTSPTTQENPAARHPTKSGESIVAALKALAKSNEWLSDQRLVEQAVSRLKNFSPQNPKECATVAAVYLKIINMNGCNGTTSAGSTSPDIPVIKMGDASLGIQWRCLKKLHALTPITHLEFTGNINLKEFLEFLKSTPTITSLKICESAAITDDQLAKMAPLLPMLETFFLHSETIATIPETLLEKVIVLDCSGCTGLRKLNTPNALSITSSHCDSLTCIIGPKATRLQCKNCPKLTQIFAPHLDELDCEKCFAMRSITTNATKINCFYNKNLTCLIAPKATNINCSYCLNLTTLEAPKAINLHCGDCLGLTAVNAPNADSLRCNSCTSLASISAPKATEIICFQCVTLEELAAPRAKHIQCNFSTQLKSIKAPKATHIGCVACPLLSRIHVPKALTMECDACPALTPKHKHKLFKTVLKNTLLTYCATPNILAEQLPALFSVAPSRFGISHASDTPLHQWLLSALEMHIPAEFESIAEKSHSASAIEDCLNKLFTLVATDPTLKRTKLDWFTALKKLHSPQQQMCRVLWLGCLLAHSAPRTTPLADPEAASTLTAIGNLADAMLLAGATRALFSMYAARSPHRKTMWKALPDMGASHLLLPRLFLTCTNIEQQKAQELLECLNSGHYKDFKQLTPILETIYALSQNSSIPVTERVKILTFLLKAPAKGEQEKSKLFAERTRAFRSLQQMRVTASRDLLLFGQGRQLIGAQSDRRLQMRHKRVCQATFGIKAEHVASFAETFRSTRYPNGLFTYAARLQTLPRDDKVPLTELLGKFVNGHLEKEFPANRYDLQHNAHLHRIFQYDAGLLDKWKAPFEVDIARTEITPLARPLAHEIIERQIRYALGNRHLGDDQERLYPALTQAVRTDRPIDIQTPIARTEKSLKDIQDQLNATSPCDLAALKETQACLEIELYCLKALDPAAEDQTKIGHLRSLQTKLPDGLEFKHDLRDLLHVLTRQRKSTARFTKLQITESWEDFLLMGTEVNNSCQRIDGDPHLNKCLLAYILDGKNQLMIVRDSQGKIAARSVLRILWDNARSCPVLFMEHIYTNAADPTLEELIIRGCVEKAKSMQLALVASSTSFLQGSPHPGKLEAFGGPALFEYVDALKGIQHNGKFIIPTSNIVYTPDDHALPCKRKRELHQQETVENANVGLIPIQL